MPTAARLTCSERRCRRRRYVYFDRYTGLRRYYSLNQTEVPTGNGRYPDKRAAGDWFITVQVCKGGG